MKRKTHITLLLIALLCLTMLFGCAKYIGKDKAIEIALSDAGLVKADVRDLECELDKEHGTAAYEVDFDVGFDDYEYVIEATTGEIVKSKID